MFGLSSDGQSLSAHSACSLFDFVMTKYGEMTQQWQEREFSVTDPSCTFDAPSAVTARTVFADRSPTSPHRRRDKEEDHRSGEVNSTTIMCPVVVRSVRNERRALRGSPNTIKARSRRWSERREQRNNRSGVWAALPNGDDAVVAKPTFVIQVGVKMATI